MKKMKKFLFSNSYLTVFGTFSAFVLVLSACAPEITDSRPQVVTSFYPLTYFSEQIAGEAVNVTQITPNGVEPHDYFLSTDDLKLIEKADLTIAQGGNFESWSEELYHGKLVEGTERVLVFSQEMDFTLNEDHLLDSHIWLDPILAQNMVSLISEQLSAMLPELAETFSANAALLNQELATLDQEIATALISCSNRKIIVTHDAFSYFVKRYGLEVLPILNAAHFDEPSLEELKELADYAKENELTAIFMETLENPEVATVLAEEANLTSLVLNPIEGLPSEQTGGVEDYFSMMRSNLANLKTGLQCP